MTIPAIFNETTDEGKIDLEVICENRNIKSEATVLRLTEEVIIIFPHEIRSYEDKELILSGDKSFQIYHPIQLNEVGKLVEKFLYRAGGERGWLFSNAKMHILQVLGISGAEKLGWEESLTLEEAFKYNFLLEQSDRNKESNSEKVKGKLPIWYNPVISQDKYNILKRKIR